MCPQKFTSFDWTFNQLCKLPRLNNIKINFLITLTAESMSVLLCECSKNDVFPSFSFSLIPPSLSLLPSSLFPNFHIACKIMSSPSVVAGIQDSKNPNLYYSDFFLKPDILAHPGSSLSFNRESHGGWVVQFIMFQIQVETDG